ncbi:hypothetical protein [Terracoccus sp. 273MFTsu3.1]|uniref:hypothetical protein n=1 Tax=Terracoccus sp. 273MFTsu3.1 TaxID=1172188 RepID=UPI00037EF76C|nr:hypothetical protein [Terracoccus sp. 273MFTsu3.1]
MSLQPGGRTSSFSDGALAQSPASRIHSIQEGAGREGFKPSSTLDENQIFTTANGQSEADRSRQPLKGPGFSTNGLSDSTFQSRLWLGSAPRTFGGK